MYRARGKIDNAYHKRASKVDKEGIEYGRLSQIIGLVADNPRKVRGFRCERLFYEESGSFSSLSTAWVQGEALITRAGRRTGTRFAWGCVCKGTKVYKANGEPINIEDIQQHDGIIGFKNGKSNVEPITYMQGEAYKPCVRITTDHGILECSEDHPILCRIKKYYKKPDGKWQRYYIYDFVKAVDVKKYARGSAIAMVDEIDNWGNDVLFDPYLVGLLIGDGSYTKKSTPTLSNCDDDVNDYVYSHFDCTQESLYHTKDGRLFKSTRIRGITKEMRKIGIYGQSKNSKRLPNN